MILVYATTSQKLATGESAPETKYHFVIRLDVLFYILATVLCLAGILSLVLIFTVQGNSRTFEVPFISDAFDHSASLAVFRTFICLTAIWGLLVGVAVCFTQCFEVARRRKEVERLASENSGENDNHRLPEADNNESRPSVDIEQGAQTQRASSSTGRNDTPSSQSGRTVEEMYPPRNKWDKLRLQYYMRYAPPLLCFAAEVCASILFILIAVFPPSESAHLISFGVAILCATLWGVLLMTLPLSELKDWWKSAVAWTFWVLIFVGGITMLVGFFLLDSVSTAAGGEYMILLATTGFFASQGLRFIHYRIVLAITSASLTTRRLETSNPS